MITPTLEYEQALWDSGAKYVAGIDEVGRGALAGPVVAAAVIFDFKHIPINGVRDSKTLSKLQKNKLQSEICHNCISFAIGEASSQEIDKLGIVAATATAMQRALDQITTIDHVLVDGTPFKDQTLLKKYQKTFIVDGDTLSYSIAAASIIAKVYRDELMQKLAITFPTYAWDKNVGYGTNQHRAAIQTVGPCEQHRRSFISSI